MKDVLKHKPPQKKEKEKTDLAMKMVVNLQAETPNNHKEQRNICFLATLLILTFGCLFDLICSIIL